MKKFIIAAAILAASVTAAQAKCSKVAMNGDWLWSFENGGAAYRLTLADGNIVLSGAPIGTYTMSSACKGTIILTGVPIIFTSRADKIEADEDIKPGKVSWGYEDGVGGGVLWHMIRL